MKIRQFQASCFPFFTMLLVLSFILLISGCVQRPLLLRNRPNIPPPNLDPLTDEIPPTYGTGVIGTPPVVIEVGKELTQVTVPEIKTAPITHTVAKGDSFWKIARQYGVSKEELAACNNLSLDTPLKIGTVLVVPPGGVLNYTPQPASTPIIKEKTPAPKKAKVGKKSKVKKNEPETKPVSGGDGTYTVQSGDSLWKISRKFNVSTKDLAEANGLDPKKAIMQGTKLVIPGGGTGEVTKTVEKAPEVTPKEDTTEKPVEEKPVDPIDDILKDAEQAAGNQTTTANPADVLDDGLNEAAKTATNPLPDDLYTEEVLPNETLQEIAERHGLKVEDLRKVNPGLPADGKLKPFSSIKIPNKQL